MTNSKRKFDSDIFFHDFFVSSGVLLGAVLLCDMLQEWNMYGQYDNFVQLIFVLAVVVVSRFTDGYFWGMFASVLGVFLVNYAFTYPYMAFNFTIEGYPFVFLVMLVVSVIVSGVTTQMKQQEQIRLEAERETMRANLLRAVSHDIRTPLTSIVGATDVLLSEDNELSHEQQKKLMQDMNEDAQWLIRIVENLLSITRINGGESAKLSKAPEVPEEVLEVAIHKFQKRFPQIGVDVELNEDFFLVPMDPILIEQVLLNLMENAVLHGGTVSSIFLRIRKRGDSALFVVEDNGGGFPKEILSQPFGQGHRNETIKHTDGKRNMGIGLSTCAAIIKAHGGELKATNRKSGGARVIFTLPLDIATLEGNSNDENS